MKPRQLILIIALLALVGTSLSAQENRGIPGLAVHREIGDGFIALNLENNALVLRFYDASKTQIQPEAPRAMAFWRFRNKRNRLPLTLQGDALRSPERVFPPLAFSVNVSLLTMEDNTVIESHNFDLRYFQSPEIPAES